MIRSRFEIHIGNTFSLYKMDNAEIEKRLKELADSGQDNSRAILALDSRVKDTEDTLAKKAEASALPKLASKAMVFIAIGLAVIALIAGLIGVFRASTPGPRGPVGANGQSATDVQVNSALTEMQRKNPEIFRGITGERGPQGPPGNDGKDLDPVKVLTLENKVASLSEKVAEFESRPVPTPAPTVVPTPTPQATQSGDGWNYVIRDIADLQASKLGVMEREVPGKGPHMFPMARNKAGKPSPINGSDPPMWIQQREDWTYENFTLPNGAVVKAWCYPKK